MRGNGQGQAGSGMMGGGVWYMNGDTRMLRMGKDTSAILKPEYNDTKILVQQS